MATVVAVSAVLALGLSACNKASTTTPSTTDNTTAAFNVAVGQKFNPSDKKGGTLKFGIAGDWDSVDPGDTYYGLSWNFVRLYGRALTMFKPVPGHGSQELVGDLAEGLGVPSDGAKTWTYKLRAGLKYEDGTPITSKDVKYAVLRTVDKDTLVNGPTYFGDTLALKGYTGPYKMPTADTDAIQTPDDRTIVFHLTTGFSGFDYFAMLPATIPVPKAKDTGVKYKEHVISSGPYKFASYEQGKSFTLVRNDQWDQATDPNRQALPDGYSITLGMNADDVDKQLEAGTLDLDMGGTGVQPAALSTVLNDPKLKAQADNPALARLQYTNINPKVAPFDNIECRKAVQYATDKVSYQSAYGGPFAGGDIATGLLPPQIPGFQKFDLYPAGADNHGDLTKAKAALTACGKPDGFETNISYRTERPKEKAAAEALQVALARVGIKLTLKAFPQKDYFAAFAGKPSYRNANNLGLLLNSWGADWNDGYGFLSQIIDSRTIREAGGSSNFSVYNSDVDKLIDQALLETDAAKRNTLWQQIDQKVMQDATVLPGLWAKALTLRSQKATNIFVNEAFGQYDYMAMGAA